MVDTLQYYSPQNYNTLAENIPIVKKDVERLEVNKAYDFEEQVIKTKSLNILKKFNQFLIENDEDEHEDGKNSVHLTATWNHGEEIDFGEYEIIDAPL